MNDNYEVIDIKSANWKEIAEDILKGDYDKELSLT